MQGGRVPGRRAPGRGSRSVTLGSRGEFSPLVLAPGLRLREVVQDDHEQHEQHRERHDRVHHDGVLPRGDPDPVSAPSTFGLEGLCSLGLVSALRWAATAGCLIALPSPSRIERPRIRRAGEEAKPHEPRTRP